MRKNAKRKRAKWLTLRLNTEQLAVRFRHGLVSLTPLQADLIRDGVRIQVVSGWPRERRLSQDELWMLYETRDGTRREMIVHQVGGSGYSVLCTEGCRRFVKALGTTLPGPGKVRWLRVQRL